MLKVTFILSVFIFSSMSLLAKNSSAELARALNLLQKKEISKAIPVLEKAFSISLDLNEKIDIADLLFSVSDENYSKKEAYLRFLISESPKTHRNQTNWLLTLGSQSFERGELKKSWDYYQEAKDLSDDPKIKSLVLYRMAWVAWNQKKHQQAFEIFLKSLNKNKSSLEDQIPKDLAALIWELGPLEKQQIGSITQWPSQKINIFISQFISRFPSNAQPTKKDKQIVRQVFSQEKLRPYVLKTLAEGLEFKEEPCFFFNEFLNTDEAYNKTSLLRCLKDKNQNRNPELYLKFLENLPKAQVDTTSLWAKLELYWELNQYDEAINLGLSRMDLNQDPQEFQTYFISLLLSKEGQNSDELKSKEHYSKLQEIIKKYSKARPLLAKLQALDPDYWIVFEEKYLIDNKNKRDFLIKKGLYLNERHEESKLNELRIQLLNADGLLKSEKQAVKALVELGAKLNTQLTKNFSKEFLLEYRTWLKTLDRAIDLHSKTPNEWRLLTYPLLSKEVQKTVKALTRQIEELKFNNENPDLVEAFDKKKFELIKSLHKKYGGVQS